MKLVDILALELRAWPHGFGKKLGQCASGSLHSCINMSRQTGQSFTLCDSYLHETVTRKEWQAAVDALNVASVPSIDWSKQPEGYPLRLEGTTQDQRKHSGWYRDCGQVFEGANGGQWRASREGQFFTVHKRPEPAIWTGEGLPPVGTVCEVFEGDESIGWEEGRKSLIGKRVTVRALFRNDCDQYICAAELNDNKCFCILAKLLRPIRTAEQIKAEERKAGIAAMINDLGANPGDTWDSLRCSQLYDAGYRKFEIVEGEG